MDKQDIKIDAVVTWVDGSDEKHYLKKRRILKKLGERTENDVQTGRDKTRFVDNGELKYCLRSIRKNIPWIHRIFLVTDNQQPSFLDEKFKRNYNLSIIDHKEIFRGYEWALPTFNSRTIETALWRIPGLSDRFIYFNDDFIISNRIKKEHFFKGDKVVLHGRWKKIQKYGKFRLKINEAVSYISKKYFRITRSMHLLLQIKSARLAGFSNKYFRVPHVPHPIHKPTLEEFFKQHPEKFEENIRYKFRSTNQFSAIHLAHHIEIRSNRAELRDSDGFLMINGEMDLNFMLERKLHKLKKKKVRYICLQGLEKFKERDQERIKKTLKKDLGLKKFKIEKQSETILSDS